MAIRGPGRRINSSLQVIGPQALKSLTMHNWMRSQHLGIGLMGPWSLVN